MSSHKTQQAVECAEWGECLLVSALLAGTQSRHSPVDAGRTGSANSSCPYSRPAAR